MAQREVQIQEGQWKDVCMLVQAVNNFNRAYDALQKAKAVFEIPIHAQVEVDVDGGRLIIIEPMAFRPRPPSIEESS